MTASGSVSHVCAHTPQTTRTRANPKDRIPAPRSAWNTSTHYDRPESLLWELTTDASRRASNNRARCVRTSVPRGKRFASAHITRAASRGPASPSRPAERVRATGRGWKSHRSTSTRSATAMGSRGGDGSRGARDGSGSSAPTAALRPRSAHAGARRTRDGTLSRARQAGVVTRGLTR